MGLIYGIIAFCFKFPIIIVKASLIYVTYMSPTPIVSNSHNYRYIIWKEKYHSLIKLGNITNGVYIVINTKNNLKAK